MGVFDGQPVSAAVTNPAFVNKNQDDIDPSILGFASTAPAAGLAFDSVQQEKNSIDSFIGRVRNTAATALPPWTHNEVGSSLDPLFDRLDAVTGLFNGSTGHNHNGTDGMGPVIAASGVGGTPLSGYGVQGNDLVGVTGTSTVVTTDFVGFHASSGVTDPGVVVTVPYNRVIIRNSANDEEYKDALGNAVYGRLTFATSVWTLSYFTDVSGTETPYSFSSSGVRYYFQAIANPLGPSWPTYSDSFFIPSANATADILVATTSIKGKSQLGTVSQPISDTGSGGTPNATVANADHVHEGVHSISASGSFQTGLGDIILVGASGVGITQVDNVITFVSGGGGSGSGTGKNYLSNYLGNPGNGNFESGNTAGWALFTTTLTGVIPTGGVGAGGASLVIAAIDSVTSPPQIAGAFSLAALSISGFAAGDGFVSDAFTIDEEDQAKVMGINFYYKAISGLFDFSGSDTNTFAVYIYDVTNSQWIQPAGVYNLVQGSGVGFCSGTFQTTSNSTEYRVAILCINGTAGVTEIYFDDFFVGPQVAPLAPAVSDWQPYTPTFGNFGTVTGIETYWRRVGDSVEVKGNFTTGTTVSGEAQIGLPPGMTADASKIPAIEVAGVFTRENAGASATDQLLTIEPGVTYFTMTHESVSQGFGKLDVSNFNSGEKIWVLGKCPIAGWSSNSVSSADTDTRVVALSANTITGQTISTSDTKVQFDVVLADTHDCYDPITNFRYVAPVSGLYAITGSISLGGTTSAGTISASLYVNGSAVLITRGGTAGFAGGFNPGISYDFLYPLSAGDYVEIWAASNPSDALTAVAPAGTILNISRLSGPAVIVATDSIVLRYTSANGNVYSSGSTLVYEDKDFDTSASYNNSTGIFKARVTGKYDIYSLFTAVATALAAGQNFSLVINKNGTPIVNGKVVVAWASTTALVSMDVGSTLNLLAGDEITITTNISTALQMQPDDTFNEFVVTRVGN